MLSVSYKKRRKTAEENESLKRKMVLMDLKSGGKNYGRLLGAVRSKFAGESRFQTALRYIEERENANSAPCSDNVRRTPRNIR